MTDTDTDLQIEMRRRVRRHMLTSTAGVVLGIVSVGVLGGVARAAGADGALRALPGLGILLIPALGFWSTYRNLRCPACESLVVMQMSWNYSLFSAFAPKECGSCGKTIFSANARRRVRRLLFIIMGAAFLLGLSGAFASRVHH